MIFETHAHYDDEAFDKDREELLKSFEAEGIGYIVNIGASIETSKKTLELTKRFPFVYGAIGVHPEEAAELNEENFDWLKKAAKEPKVVAVGEIGLDYYWKTEPEVQKIWFERQMELAKEVKLPAVIHSRDAAADTLDMIKGANLKETGGVIHCFSYGVEMAREYLNMGFYLGIGGVITFKNGKKLKEVVEYAPLDALVLETDSPYLTPEPNRGKRNCSLYLKQVAEKIAELKGVAYDEVVRITEENAKRLYGFI
ncbi:deoxyribonuclease [Anaerocolumna cellulosilytica]|uniref:Deoxyribonuclease n=1 Tax=Anaerocolumna cellulosilytica TaxID=433286 RepID=A0A6S6RCD4_9FIRM|nr:TatD family hydrolase [Anaerocolumna cellulosilytica]MBB5195882.1 TatD DNase family protein [Anaerocolumna cellulosilytica]BCJ96892.1 deoxyribonuclease [Anaerocolumna cellulosilytica]